MAAGALRFLNRLEETVALFFFFLMSLFVFLQLVFRFLLNNPLFFAEEISRYAYVWITFVGLSLATKNREHIRVNALVQQLPVALQRRMDLAVHVASLLLLLWLTYLGFRFMGFSKMSISPALEMPMNIVYLSLPLGCLLGAIRLAAGVWGGQAGSESR